MMVKRSRPRAGLGARAARLALAVGVCAGLLREGRAHAHPEPGPDGTNRYVTATVTGGRIEIADVWLQGALAAVETRRQLDGDGDGRVSPDERAQGERENAAADDLLTVTLDGSARSPAATVSIDLGGDDSVGGAPVSVERRLTLDLGGDAAHELRLALGRDPPHVVASELAIDLEPGLALLSPPAGAPAPPENRAVFLGPRRSSLENRAAAFAFAAVVAPPRPANGGRTRAPLAAALAALAGVLLAAVHPLRGRRGPRLVELGAHAAFPALVGGLLSYARARLGVDGAAPAAGAALAAAGLAAVALHPRAAHATGHDDAHPLGLLVPSVEMLALATLGAALSPAAAAAAALSFGITLAARDGALPVRARRLSAIAAAAAIAAAIAVAR
jgi:hypothetical protein